MKKTIIALLILFTGTAAATEISLTANDTNLTLGQAMTFWLVVKSDDLVTGSFLVEREYEPNRFELTKTFIGTGCSLCVGGSPSSGYDESFYFKPPMDGRYIATANFAGVREKLEFQVYPVTTTTTTRTTTSTTTSTTSSTTTTTTTTSTTTTTTTTTTVTTTTTLASGFEAGSGIYILVLIILVAASAVIFFLRRSKK